MKKIIAGAIALVALAMIPLAISAADDATTLKGEPIDITCYLKGQSGLGHAACATGCANKGLPLGIVAEVDGKKVVYLALAAKGLPKDLLADHMGKQIEVTGKVSTKDGLHSIVIDSVK